MSIGIGYRAQDVTGFWGLVTARCEYMGGRVQLQIERTALRAGDKPESMWVDEERCIPYVAPAFISGDEGAL